MLDEAVAAVPHRGWVRLVRGRGIAVVEVYDGVGGHRKVRHVHPGDELAGSGRILLDFVRQRGYASAAVNTMSVPPGWAIPPPFAVAAKSGSSRSIRTG